jgi:exoenzyme U
MSQALTTDQWINRVLGVNYVRDPASQPLKQVRFAPVTVNIPPPPKQPVQLGSGVPSGKSIAPTQSGEPEEFTGQNGRKLTVTKTTTGSVLFTAPPPPVGEITFSGGGAKGAALPGAVRALEQNGVLKDAKKIAGASVGSMTAALVAAGATADEFAAVANADSTTQRIVEGTGGTKLGMLAAAIKNKVTTVSGNPLTGQGLEDVVRDVLDATLKKRIVEYARQCANKNEKPDPGVVKIAEKLTSDKKGATFGDMRALSKVIPAIKEVVISGTYTKEFTKDDKGKLKELKGGNDRGQLYIFDADSEPDMPVSIAVHASASFPAAFKPVDITLSSGLTVRFIDGGVMNNTPTTSSVGAERDLDPIPQSRGMTFVFEDKEGVADKLLKGAVSPSQGKMARLVDWFVNSDNAAGEYAKNRDMTDHPEQVVMVPLTLELPGKKPGSKPKKYDMRDGTLNFGLSMEAKIGFQEKTQKATQEQIDREKQPKSREFTSDSQMFVCIGMADLKTLMDSKYPGAAEAYDFREKVAEMIGKLTTAVDQATANGGHVRDALNDQNATMALDELNKLAGDDVDFQGYVGREMNRGKLDTLLDAMKAKGGASGGAMEATFAVSEALRAHEYADNILKQLVYPHMKLEKEGGAGIQTLLNVEGLLRGAKTPDDVNLALDIAINHFKNKSDLPPRKGHKQFAEQLERRMMH